LPSFFLKKKKIFNVCLIVFLMKKYKVFRSVEFQKEISKYDKNVQDRVDKIEDKLMLNPGYGNPLGTRWFRESRFENYRIYYLIYEDLQAVYIVAISSKKDQQKTINTIKLFLEFFRDEIEKAIREDDLQDKES
jgi:mRNA-degrading endonuclease RelE of RelBE toxin-antitoxin system